jgi:hypothetical protein
MDVPNNANIQQPSWLAWGKTVKRSVLFRKLAGLVTYGSPLDKFASIWPETVALTRDTQPLTDKVWLNVWDATDPVAGELDQFGAAAPFAPDNRTYAGSMVPLLSHIKYLTVPHKPKGGGFSPQDRQETQDSFAGRMAEWWYNTAQTGLPAPALPPSPSNSPFWPSPLRQKVRGAMTNGLWLSLAVIFPLLTAAFLRLIASQDLLYDPLADSIVNMPFWHLAVGVAGFSFIVTILSGVTTFLLESRRRP